MQAPDGSSPPKIPYHESRNAELDGNKFLPPYPSAAAFDHNETDILLEDDSRKPVSYTHLTLPTKRIV